MKQCLGVSKRRACRVPVHSRPTECFAPKATEDEQSLTDDIVDLTSWLGRYGYLRITALLGMMGSDVNHKRVKRLRRQAELKVPAKQPNGGWMWPNDGPCVRLQPAWKNHVCAHHYGLESHPALEANSCLIARALAGLRSAERSSVVLSGGLFCDAYRCSP